MLCTARMFLTDLLFPETLSQCLLAGSVSKVIIFVMMTLNIWGMVCYCKRC